MSRGRSYPNFWLRCEDLMLRYPPGMPTKVKIVHKLDQCYAICHKYKKRFEILIERPKFKDVKPNDHKLTYREAFILENFIHEYAHVLNWSHVHDNQIWLAHHDPGWGVKYAMLYQAIIKER